MTVNHRRHDRATRLESGKAKGRLKRAVAVCLALGVWAGPARGEESASPPVPGLTLVDLRPAFTNWGLPLRSQGKRGTCSVFTVVGALEYALARQQGTGRVLSVEYLNWASNEAAGNPHDGGFFSDLWRGYEVHGICAEAELPYRPEYDPKLQPPAEAVSRSKQLAASGLRVNWIKRWDVRTGLTEDQVGQIKNVLTQRWPVCGGFRWPKRERWPSGVLEMVPPAEVFDGHSVLLVGFREDSGQPGGGVFLIRNTGGGPPDAAMSVEYIRAYMNDALWIDLEPRGKDGHGHRPSG